MKTAKEFLRQFIDIECDVDEAVIINTMKEYALEACKEALRIASNNNVIYTDTVDENGEETTGKVVYQSDITSINNIPEEVRKQN